MADDAARVATTYFDAWKVNDFDTMRSLVDDDATFAGPLARLEGGEDYMEGIKGMSQIKSDIVIQRTFVDDPDVVRPAHDGCFSRTRRQLAPRRGR
jgi:hypothetical protein